jgi:lysozyme
MQTSAKGVAYLERKEGVVLKTYICPAGHKTIGAGLTKASGVIDPKIGMTITAEESARLTALALKKNYEPRVVKALAPGGTPAQHEFDAAVSFDWNTGAIHRASWVKAWHIRDWVQVLARLKLWTKGGGKVLPGLLTRRLAEYRLMKDGDYGLGLDAPRRPAGPVADRAVIAAPITSAQVPAIREALITLGYGGDKAESHLRLDAVRAFQNAHGLTVDGIVGRATASAIQRALDVRRKAVAPTVGAAAATPVASTDVGDQLAGLPWIGPVLLGLAALYALSLAWRYRDTVAAAIDRPLPRLAAFLRSF